MTEKPKMAMYWAAACGGCEIALLAIHEKINELVSFFEPVFWPCLMDGKLSDVQALPDQGIALTLFNGAIRNQENAEMARLLRKKTEILIAFGSCAHEGCIPGLSNFSTAEDHFNTIYLESPSIHNPKGVLPRVETQTALGTLRLPAFHDDVKRLDQVVPVDYMVPGCPPEAHQVKSVLDLFLKKKALPDRGTIIGAGTVALCNECPKKKGVKHIARLYQPHERIPDSETCLLEQGLLCMGPATRSGCNARCPQNDMPCIGCYGPPAGVADQGGAMLSALASVMAESDLSADAEALEKEARDLADGVIDPAGTFYMFSLARSILQRARRKQ